MQFANLDLTSSVVPGSGMSLSASICREGRDLQDYNYSDNDSEIDLDERDRGSDHESYGVINVCSLNAMSMAMNGQQSGSFSLDQFDDDASISHKLLSWKDQSRSMKKSPHSHSYSSLKTPHTPDRSEVHTPLSSGGIASLQSSCKSVIAHAGTGGKYCNMSRKSSPLTSFRLNYIGEIKGTARGSYLTGTGYDEETLLILIRAYSIISASLLQRCVIGEGTFLDFSTCSTHETDSCSSLLTKRRRNSEHMHEDIPTTSMKSKSMTGNCIRSLDTMTNGDNNNNNHYINNNNSNNSNNDNTNNSNDNNNDKNNIKRRTKKNSIDKNQINMLFSIREFLEGVPESELESITPSLTEISNFSLGASMRVLKLISPSMFVSCLPSHMNEAEKIGTGGFGSVFKVCCDSSCLDHNGSPIYKSTPYQSYNSRSNSGKRSSLMNAYNAGNNKSSSSFVVKNDNGSTAYKTIYAVKRIPRERSVYDSPIIYDIFSEITSLELLAGNRGVSELIDFGVQGVEYWMVMEAGKLDLLAWRHTPNPKNNSTRSKRIPPTRSPFDNRRNGPDELSARSNGMTDLEESTGEEMGSERGTERGTERDDDIPTPTLNNMSPSGDVEEVLTRCKLAMCLALYADALLIVQSVHSANVLHFDIKCNNFILRCEPDLDNMYRAHEKGNPSGYLFLADFGESVPSLVSYSNKTQVRAEDYINNKSTPICTKVSASAPIPVLPISRNSPSSSLRSTMSQPIHVVEGGPSNLSRSRGTLAIQSPEMLCLTAASSSIAALPIMKSKSPPLMKPFSTSTCTSRTEGKDCFGSELDINNLMDPRGRGQGHGHGQVQGEGEGEREIDSNSSKQSPLSSRPETQTQTKIQNENKASSSRKSFPPPSAASDVWSLGCLLMELITGNYLMADRSWPELYVSFCMKKFVPPSLEKLKKAVEHTESPTDLVPRLESIVNMCLIQEPHLRGGIIDIFELLMTMVIDHGALTPIQSKLILNSDSNSNSKSNLKSNSNSNSYSNFHSNSTNNSSPNNSNILEPRHVSSVLLNMKSLLSTKQVNKWAVAKTFHVVKWNRETLSLQSRSLDFRCGSGLVITLLNSIDGDDNDNNTNTNNNINDNNIYNNSNNNTNNSSNDNTNTYSNSYTTNTNTNNNTNNDDSLRINSNLKSKSKSSHSTSNKRNNVRHPYIPLTFINHDGNEDLSAELKYRINSATKMIATTSLLTCSKNLAKKSVVNFVRDEGVFHIEISCGPNKSNEDDIDMKRNYSLKGIERLVLPTWCNNCSETLNDDNDTEHLDDLFSDIEVIKSIERLLCLAHATLTDAVPPAILITIVPIENFIESPNESPLFAIGKTKPGPGPGPYPPQTGEVRKDRKENLKYTEFEKEDDIESSSCVYSKVALTVAVTLADYFAKTLSVRVKDQDSFRSPKGAIIEVHGQIPSAKGSYLMPRGNTESRRNDFEYNKAMNILYQSKCHTRKKSFAVSQSLNAVAPWLKKALHSEFQSFLLERLNLPNV